MKFRKALVVSLATMALPWALSAQTTGTGPSTCTPPTSLTALSIERPVSLSNILTTITPNAPASVLAAIAAGAQEIREQLIYNAQLNTVTSTIFLVAPGSPAQTPATNISSQNTLDTATINITQIMTSCNPTPSILLVGTVSNSLATGPFGSFNGAPAAVSIGYTNSTTTAGTVATISNVAVVIAGMVLEYSPAATGTLSFPSTAVTPPGSTGAAGLIVKVGGTSITASSTTPMQVSSSPFTFSVTSSTGAPLSYTFTSNPPVSFLLAGTPGQVAGAPNQVSVNFPSQGDYTIAVTGTDTSGNVSTISFVLEYTGSVR